MPLPGVKRKSCYNEQTFHSQFSKQRKITLNRWCINFSAPPPLCSHKILDEKRIVIALQNILKSNYSYSIPFAISKSLILELQSLIKFKDSIATELIFDSSSPVFQHPTSPQNQIPSNITSFFFWLLSLSTKHKLAICNFIMDNNYLQHASYSSNPKIPEPTQNCDVFVEKILRNMKNKPIQHQLIYLLLQSCIEDYKSYHSEACEEHLLNILKQAIKYRSFDILEMIKQFKFDLTKESTLLLVLEVIERGDLEIFESILNLGFDINYIYIDRSQQKPKTLLQKHPQVQGYSGASRILQTILLNKQSSFLSVFLCLLADHSLNYKQRHLIDILKQTALNQIPTLLWSHNFQQLSSLAF